MASTSTSTSTSTTLFWKLRFSQLALVLVLILSSSLLRTSSGSNADGSSSSSSSNDNDDTNNNNNNNNEEEEEPFVCGVYLAPSTLPGTGIGMFAGARGYQTDETITKRLGDHVIPIVDLKMTHSDTGLYFHDNEHPDNDNRYFLWDQYTWSARAFGINVEYTSEHETALASAGFGAAANSFMDFVNNNNNNNNNNDNWYSYSPSLMHRSQTPGAGAFSTLHSRQAWATQTIQPYQELFANYGDTWFTDRAWRLGTIPVTGDHSDASELYQSYYHEIIKTTTKTNNNNKNNNNNMFRQATADFGFWDSVVSPLRSIWTDSRILAALPGDDDPHKDELYESMSLYIKRKQDFFKRTPEWLSQHGVCADTVRIGVSTIPHAGHGAFAETSFRPGDVVLSAPLIHIPHEDILDTYFDFTNIKTGSQLLLNYVFGHKDSTLLLSPYGPGVQLINHCSSNNNNNNNNNKSNNKSNNKCNNVKLAWASPERSNHKPHLLNHTVDYLTQHHTMGSVLALEIVATKHIAKNDEILLDYGDEWEAAWQRHVEDWNNNNDRNNDRNKHYSSATELNARNAPLPNVYGHSHQSKVFPPTVRLLVSTAWMTNNDDNDNDNNGDNDDDDDSSKFLYTAIIKVRIEQEQDEDEDEQEHRYVYEDKILTKLPRRAFLFEDLSYTQDLFLPNAFRHKIGIPDDVFPDAWKNKNNNNNNNDNDDDDDGGDEQHQPKPSFPTSYEGYEAYLAKQREQEELEKQKEEEEDEEELDGGSLPQCC
eukprot:jgi/Psemu1/256427/estExt_Genewise1Plus.C_1820001